MKRKLAALLLTLLLLAGCAGEKRALTEAEIARANEAFFFMKEVVENGTATQELNEVSCFFTSYYSRPSEIDLEEFLRYCPVGTILEEEDVEEYRAVLTALEIDPEKFPLPRDYIVPVHRYRKADVSALLEAYTGITADDLNNTAGILYLEAYDAYYNFTSDFGPGVFECVGGEQQGDTIRFWSEADADGTRKVLTLREADGVYLIQKFEKEAG